MAPEAMVRATQSWLQSSWQVQVPFAWLEACVEWLQEEAGGAGLLSQQQINQQSLDQWLLTDLRDLDHPVLPAGLAQSQTTELRGVFCVQVDSLLDISQPVYGQLQKWKGTDCANDEVSAVTQTTQRPWESRPTRMLLLQVTDGVQNLEAMEYQPIPALSTALRPGVKLQLQGQMACRLGVLLLGPSNVRVLGGEVEDLVDRNNQGRVLCRTLGVPEEQQQQDEEGASPSHRANQEVDDMELDDQELLASLEAEEEVERVRPVGDSGYVTLCETSTQSSRGSSARMLIANVPSTSETSAHSSRGGLTQSSRVGPVGPVGPVGSVGSVEGRHTNGPEDTDLYRLSSSDHVIQQEMTEHRVVVEDFPEEGFDDLPLDELDSVIFQENREFNSGPDSRIETNPNSSKTSAKPQTGQVEQHHSYSSAPSEPSRQSSHTPANDGSDFMDENMDCLEVDSFAVDTNRTGEPPQSPFHPQTSGERDGATSSLKPSSTSSHSVPLEQSRLSIAAESDGTSAKHPPGDDVTAPGVTLTSPPFTYLSLFEEVVSRPRPHVIRFCVKAFIVTLLGNLSGKSGLWRVCATISDGTGYLDVELSNEVLTSMLGFSVAEKGALKRNPARRSELDAGMKRCQEQLVDMCCVMTLAVEPGTRKAVVMKADPVSEEVYQQLEQRVRDRRK